MYVCLYGCMFYLIKHALPVFAIIALWPLLHLGTPRYGICLSIYLYIYLSIYLSIYQYIYNMLEKNKNCR